MLDLAICDDDASELSRLSSIIQAYKEMHILRHDITYSVYQNAIDLIADIENGRRYDIILLDIVMPLTNGIEAAKEIRTFDQRTKIIFLTASPEFAVDSYTVHAFYYALKPVMKDQLFAVLDKACAETNDIAEPHLFIDSKSGLMRIPLRILEYAEIQGRTIHYHLINGTVIEETGVMAKLEQVLKGYPLFTKPHRAYIINLNCIRILTQRDVQMQSGIVIPVAKANYKALKAEYMNCTFQNCGGA